MLYFLGNITSVANLDLFKTRGLVERNDNMVVQ